MTKASVPEKQGALIGDAIVDAALTPKTNSQLPTPQAESSSEMFIRLAQDQNISVEKIERLMALWERQDARRAETAFNAAMAEAQAEMQPVRADASNPQTNSKYASYEALDRALRPIYTKYGFGLSFDTAESAIDTVLVLCYVTHRDGHQRTYRVLMPADGKGAKGGDVMTKTHATGSGMSYGQRYLLKLIFNVAVEEDDDGNRAGGRPAKPVPPAPEGYDAWFATLEGIADNGEKEFEAAWSATSTKPEFRKYLSETAPKVLAALKNRARSKGRK